MGAGEAESGGKKNVVGVFEGVWNRRDVGNGGSEFLWGGVRKWGGGKKGKGKGDSSNFFFAFFIRFLLKGGGRFI